MAVQNLAGGALAPSSMEGGNMVNRENMDGAYVGSEPITPMPESPNVLDQNLPMPKIPADRLPVSTQAGKHGGVGLPPSPPMTPGDHGAPWTTGVQGGGNQGGGNPGAGSSGADVWKPTPSS